MLLAVTAQKFGCRPSDMVRLRDPLLALEFDLAAAARLLAAERSEAGSLVHGTEDGPQRAREIRW